MTRDEDEMTRRAWDDNTGIEHLACAKTNWPMASPTEAQEGNYEHGMRLGACDERNTAARNLAANLSMNITSLPTEDWQCCKRCGGTSTDVGEVSFCRQMSDKT